MAGTSSRWRWCSSAGYGLGSIPFGLLLTRWAGAGDIRAIGSGNIGATNVLRTGRKGLALATLLLDLAKGALPAVVGLAWLGPLGAVLGGGGAILGHCFPVWLGFRGGKGVATAAGVVLGLTPMLFAVILAAFVAVVAATRWVSLGSITAACTGAAGRLADRRPLGSRALPPGRRPDRLQAPREHRPAAQGRGEPAQLRRQGRFLSPRGAGPGWSPVAVSGAALAQAVRARRGPDAARAGHRRVALLGRWM